MKNTRTNKPKILLVDDEPNILSSYGRGLRHDWDLITASSGEEGLKAIREEGPFAVIVSDFNMPRMDGIAFLSQAIELAPESVRMMLTGEGDFHIATKAVNEGNIFRFMTKPCPLDNLHKALQAGHQQYRLLQIEKEAHQQEIAIAGEIQQALLLESVPENLPGVDIAAVSVPSQGVDGDFIDFFRFSESKFDVVVGDVMGKGVHAAMVGAGARNRLSRIMWDLSRGISADPEPVVIMQALSNALEEQLGQLCKFVTMVYARFDLNSRVMTYVDAGHMPTLWYSTEKKEWIPLKGRNFPIGSPALRPVEQCQAAFKPGDSFLFYSDGLLEGRNRAGQMYGDHRFMTRLGQLSNDSAANDLQSLKDDFKAFMGHEQYGDDLTIVLVKIRQG